MLPSKSKDNLIASLVLSKIELFKFSKFPEKIAKENDNIIKIGQTIFNIQSPFNFISKLLFLLQIELTNFTICDIVS